MLLRCIRFGNRLSSALINPYLPGLIILLLVLAGLRLVFLSADFPVGAISSPGMAYTDEGWWSRNAIAFLKTGRWYIDDGYNTIFSLPILPILQVGWFSIFGISLTAARLLTVLCLWVIAGLVYAIARREIKSGLAWIAPFIVLSSYPIFVYSRIALLEMPMLMLILISLWLAIISGDRPATKLAKIASSAIFFALAVLTKTSALFALPMLVTLVFLQSNRQSNRQLHWPAGWPAGWPANWPAARLYLSKCRLQSAAIWLLIFAIPVGIFFELSSHGNSALSHSYFEDFNVAGKTHKGLLSVVKGPLRTLKYSFELFPLQLICLGISLATLIRLKDYRSNLVFQIALLWSLSILLAFSLSNFAAPRYFVIWIVPVALAVPLAIEHFLIRASWRKTLFLSIFSLAVIVSLSQIAVYLSTAKFTLVNTSKDIDAIVAADSTHSALVMGHFADTLALASNDISAINDQMGFRDLDYRISVLKPGYYVSYGKIAPSVASKLKAYYRLELLETFDVYQNYDYGKPVCFYRLTSFQAQ
ncbi:MAG: glycosyltransferase family 39 protein [Phormidesmis sp.]